MIIKPSHIITCVYTQAEVASGPGMFSDIDTTVIFWLYACDNISFNPTMLKISRCTPAQTKQFSMPEICTKVSLLVLLLSHKHTIFQLSLCISCYNFTNACNIIIELGILNQPLHHFKMVLTGMVKIHVHYVIECTNFLAWFLMLHTDKTIFHARVICTKSVPLSALALSQTYSLPAYNT